MARRRGRGRLSSIQLLPEEVSDIVIWAAGELQAAKRTQIDIYKDFAQRLDERQREARGELEFDIPSRTAFNRYSIGLDAMTREMNEMREMASAVVGTLDEQESDDLTLCVTEAIKGIIFHLIRTRKDEIDPKAIANLSNGMLRILQAQNVSTARRQKIEQEYRQKVATSVETAARERGMSDDTVEAIKAKILGVA